MLRTRVHAELEAVRVAQPSERSVGSRMSSRQTAPREEKALVR